jgi:hypothetical protein
VWTVHHGCAPGDHLARTIRGRHLFPAVPTRKLPILARRLDAVRPELALKRVF